MLDKTFQFLEDQALAQPTTFVHRDYHSRNLLYREAGVPGVIDFQDALWGPVTYDLVSLLRDCYVRWSPEQVRRWAIAYANMAIEVSIISWLQAHSIMNSKTVIRKFFIGNDVRFGNKNFCWIVQVGQLPFYFAI